MKAIPRWTSASSRQPQSSCSTEVGGNSDFGSLITFRSQIQNPNSQYFPLERVATGQFGKSASSRNSELRPVKKGA
jgi:hypothetical protein